MIIEDKLGIPKDNSNSMVHHIQVIIKGITASEVEEIVDCNLGTKCEWLDGSDNTGNRFVIRYEDYSCYISANEELLNAGADVEEL